MAEKRPALGRGLSALIPDAPAAPERTFDVDIDLLRPNRFQPRTAMDDGRLEDLARVDPRERRHPADRRTPGRRRLRDHRRRAPLARLTARRPAQVPGRRARDLPRTAPCRRAHREHSARGSEPDRGSARLSPARRRIPSDAGADRRVGRQGSIVDRELRAAAEAAARGPRERRERRPFDGPRARARRASPTKRRCCAWRETSSRSSSPCARPKR